MADGKLLEVDKDEWFFQSLKKYSNLYMFELEFPLDTFEVINETSLLVSGVQAYSKSCELLQLCVPPKLLQTESDEGLCKDRDFKILSGGYAAGRIKQVKFIQSSTNLVATYQDGYNGVVIYEAGDDNRATILEKCRLETSNGTTGTRMSLYSMNDKLIFGTDPYSSGTLASDQRHGVIITEWKMDETSPTLVKTHYIWRGLKDFEPGNIVKVKEWSHDTCIFLTSRGTLALYDFRTGTDAPSVFFHASKSPNNVSRDLSLSTQGSVIFSFDCMPQRNQIGVLDSCGGYEMFDPRFVASNERDETNAEERGTMPTSTRSRCFLSQEFSDLSGIYSDHFNIEYEQSSKMREKERNRFVISGLKKDCVPVLEEHCENTADTSNIQTVFSHDGHSKAVTHATWHPVASNLIFSASIDAVLHAWQFIPEAEK